jgi:hypothetical protein
MTGTDGQWRDDGGSRESYFVIPKIDTFNAVEAVIHYSRLQNLGRGPIFSKRGEF